MTMSNMLENLTILYPTDADQYLYDNYWRRIGRLFAPDWWDFSGLSIPPGRWSVAYGFDHTTNSDGSYLADRFASGGWSAYVFEFDGEHDLVYSPFHTKSQWVRVADVGSVRS